MRNAGCALTLFLVLVFPGAPLRAGGPFAAPPLNWIDFERIAAGEIVYTIGKADHGVVTIDAAARIRAPRQAIWEILKSCEIAPEISPSVVACRRVAEAATASSDVFVQTVKPAFFVPRFEHTFRLDYFPYDRIEVQRISGPLGELAGAWWLRDQPDGTVLLIHSLRLHPGLPVPRVLVRMMLRNELPAVIAGVRERAEQLTAELKSPAP